MATVADQFAETLAAVGVKRIYGIVGDSLNGLTDALRRQGKIEWVHVRHEEVAAFAAGAEAHLTGNLAVCAGGVAVVVIPGDVALQPASNAAPVKLSGLIPAAPLVTPAKRELDRLAALLNGGRRITILCGSGCQGAHTELLELGGRLKAP